MLEGMKEIIVAVDFSDGMEAVMASARSFADAFGARLHLVNVVETTPIYTMYGMHPEEIPTIADYRDVAVDRAGERIVELGARVRGEVLTKILEGDAVDEILAYSEAVSGDLVMVATHGHTAIGSVLMGSVSSGLVRKAEVPVLVVPVAKKG